MAGTEINGVCYAVFCYDIGFAINLDEAERNLSAAAQRTGLKHTQRAPAYLQYRPPPLRVAATGAEIELGDFRSQAALGVMIYDFGAVSVTYGIPLSGKFEGLLPLAAALYDNRALLTDSRRQAEALLEAIRPAVGKASLADLVEDYLVYHLHGLGEGGPPPAAFVDANRHLIAQILRSERGDLSEQEVEDAVGSRISYGRDDLTLVDWNAAMVFAPPDGAEDVLAVLEFANVELLEMRYLDDRLDETLDRAYTAMGGVTWRRILIPGAESKALAHLARMQVDHALLFEGVNNALKLLGDQYLARLSRMAGDRLHLPEWDASVLRKLETVQNIYEKITDRLDTRRLEVLEWIIILLIFVSIILPFIGLGY